MKKTRATIKDIAKIANVTPQAVSRALNDAPNISKVTKMRILEIAAQLGYCKNASASALRSGSTNTIAIVYDELKNIYYSVMIDFLQSCLKAYGYSILVFSYRYTYLTKETYLNAISHNVDGIISFLDPKEEVGELIERYRVPVLLFGRYTPIANIDCIFSDDRNGGRLAAQHFLEEGCKNALVVTFPDEVAYIWDRVDGFYETFSSRQGNLVRTCLKDGDFLNCFLSYFQGENAPDCIFCFNDMIAFETLNILSSGGYKIPLVIGYDNIQEQVPIPYRLTTVGAEKFAMAEEGVTLLLERIAGRAFRIERMVPVKFVHGVTA